MLIYLNLMTSIIVDLLILEKFPCILVTIAILCADKRVDFEIAAAASISLYSWLSLVTSCEIATRYTH